MIRRYCNLYYEQKSVIGQPSTKICLRCLSGSTECPARVTLRACKLHESFDSMKQCVSAAFFHAMFVNICTMAPPTFTNYSLLCSPLTLPGNTLLTVLAYEIE
jgi:hypothetical protein